MTALAPVPAAEVAEPAAPARPARVAAILAVVVALVGAVLGPTGGLDGLLGPGAVTVAAGEVERQRGDTWVAVDVGQPVPDGATIRVPTGTATLDVPGGQVDLAEGSRATVDDTLTLTVGTVVVRSPRLAVGDDAVLAEGPGTWRYDATGRVGVYDGSAVVTDATGREALVRSLTELRVRDGVLAGPTRPYVYTDADPFDPRYLATAFEVDDYVSALRGGLTADYGSAPQPVAFYTDFDGLDGALVAAVGDVGFDRVGDRIGPPAAVLVAAVVTDALVVDAGLPAAEAAALVRDRRLAGATWGLIAQANDLDAGNVRAAADRALTRRQLAEAQGTATPVAGFGVASPSAPTPADAPAIDDGDTPDASGPSGPDGSGEGDPGAPPPDGETPEQDGGLLRQLVDDSGAGDLVGGEAGDLVDDVVDAGDDLLEGPDPSGGFASEPVDDGAGGGGDGLLDTTGEVLRGTVDTVEDTVGGLLGD